MSVTFICTLPLFAYSDEDNVTVAVRQCSKITEPEKRLLCFDLLAANMPTEQPVDDGEKNGKWTTKIEQNKIDDTSIVTVYLEANEPIEKRLSGNAYPTLVFRCRDNKTEAFVTFFKYFETNENHNVLVRIDSDKAQKQRWSSSTDGRALFVGGDKHIPFIKSLKGHSRLVIQATPYNSGNIVSEFDLSGIDEALEPLQKACGWN